jgi:hypothetical protein
MNPLAARIYQPAKTAMQSGGAKDAWVLEYVIDAPAPPEPLMGWNPMHDTREEITLKFDSKEQAIAFAKAKHLAYEIILPQVKKTAPKAYAANFAASRRRAYAEQK